MRITCADALTMITGRLCVPVERLYTLYNEMTRDTLYTHQLVRAGRTAEPYVRAQLPEVAEWADRPENAITGDNWHAKVIGAEKKFGKELHIEPLPEWKRTEPLAELIEMTGEGQAPVGSQGQVWGIIYMTPFAFCSKILQESALGT